MVDYLCLIFLALAAICNSLTDKLLFHYFKSIFSSDFFSTTWWHPAVSSRNKYKRTPRVRANLKYKFPFAWMVFTTDAFHFIKSLMIVFIALAIMSYKPICNWNIELNINLILFTLNGKTINLLSDLLILGFAWNLPFNFFFNIVWKKRTT